MAGFLIYQANLPFSFRTEGGGLDARFPFTNGLLMDGLRSGFQIIEHDHASLAAEDRQDDGGVSLHPA